jgi:two-component system, sensor histidine kinase and response regulator
MSPAASSSTVALEQATRPRPPVRDPAPSVAELAHDLRSPLTSILLLVDAMRSGRCGPLTPELERHLETVRDAAAGATAIVAGVAGGSHSALLGHHESLNELSATSLHEMVREVLASVQPLAALQGRSVIVDLPSFDVELRCHDPMRRVLLNLLDNAVKHSSLGDVTLQASVGPSGALRAVITDNGRSEMEVDHKAVFPSGGLGLPIVSRLLETLDSRLYRAERESGGMMYWFDIPADQL